MKRFFLFLLLLALVTSAAGASGVDLSGMTFDELVALREQLNLAIWNSAEWQEVNVPEGIWIVGEDIPAGHWSIRVAAKHDYFYVLYFDKLDDVGKRPARDAYIFSQDIATEDYHPFGEINATSVDIDMKEGWYFECGGEVIFTPFAGKPDLGFK